MNAPLTTRLALRLLRAAGNWIAPAGEGQGRVCILNYHRVLPAPDPLLPADPDVATFRWQMALLAEHFNVLPLQTAMQALATQRMPPRAVCITFDDGYRSTHDLALPILREFGLPATVFVTSAYVGHSAMWNDRIVEAIRCFKGDRLDLESIGMGSHDLHTMADRKRVLTLLTQSAKYLPSPARLQLTDQLEQLTGTAIPTEQMLTSDMLVTLSTHRVDIGAHTITHPILTKIDDDSARHEIAGSKQQLEALIGKPVNFFAYPNGKAGIDFDQRHVQMTKDAGFTAAFASSSGAATGAHDRYQMPRCHPWDATPALFALRLLRWLANK